MDREKVIRGLQAIQDEAYDRWVHRQYIEDPLITLIRDNISDALALLREQDTVEHAIEVLKAHGWKDETEVTGDA